MSEKKKTKMKTRIITSIGMFAVIFPCVLIGGWAIRALLLAIVALASYEITSLFDQKADYLMCILMLVAITLVMYVPLQLLAAVVSGWLILLFLIELIDEKRGVDHIAYIFLMTILIGIALRCMLGFYSFGTNVGFRIACYVALASFGCDIGAYFFGVFFGKHKMIPRISPNKTWEGSLGGYFSGALLSCLFALFLIPEMDKSLMIAGSLLMPIVSQIGDLAFSSVKRHFGVKDFGKIFPGHGGALDRIDSYLFCLLAMQVLMNLWGIA